MATIALYANKINQMPGLIKDVKQSVIDYKSELSALKTKTLTINKSVCNLDDVISSIQTSTQTQEQKIASLDTFNQNSENFISDVVRIDSNVADVIRQRKDEFYDKYYYLKPECEKDWKEYAKDLFDTACEWCKEHWKSIVTGFIVVAAIVCLFIPGVNAWVAGLVCGKLMLAMAAGALIGAGVGGLLGGTMSAITGGSFWEGFENGAFGGAIAGLISGGMAFTFTGGVASVSLTLGQTLLIGAVSGGGSSLIGDLGDKFFKGADISCGQMLLNTAFSAALGAAFAGVFYGLSKGFAALKLKFINGKANLPEAVGVMDDVVEGVSGSGSSSSVITPEMETKILEGQRVGNSNRIIGGHSPSINNNNVDFATETIQTFPDGTKKIQYVKQFSDGNASKLKTSTIFPDSWSDTKILDSIKEVGNGSSIGYRARDGATLYRSVVDGVQIEVIKIGDNVVSGYPTGGGATGLLSGFQ